MHGHCVLSMALVGLFVENLASTACGSVWEVWGTLAGRNESLTMRGRARPCFLDLPRCRVSQPLTSAAADLAVPLSPMHRTLSL